MVGRSRRLNESKKTLNPLKGGGERGEQVSDTVREIADQLVSLHRVNREWWRPKYEAALREMRRVTRLEDAAYCEDEGARDACAVGEDLRRLAEDFDPHTVGFCCRYASNQSCVGCGDPTNGEELADAPPASGQVCPYCGYDASITCSGADSLQEHMELMHLPALASAPSPQPTEEKQKMTTCPECDGTGEVPAEWFERGTP